MSMKQTARRHQSGFTIVELMMATTVFAVILLLVTTGIIQIGRNYYKGTISAKTQEAARSVADAIAQNIQFAGGIIIPTDGSMNNGNQLGTCIGDKRYSFTPRALTTGAINTNRGLVVDTVSGGCSSVTNALPNGQMLATSPTGEGLLAPGMRVVKIEVNNAPPGGSGLYDVTVRIAFGDDDVLCSPTDAADDCSAYANPPSFLSTKDDLKCRDRLSTSRFCSVSEISTTVHKRL